MPFTQRRRPTITTPPLKLRPDFEEWHEEWHSNGNVSSFINAAAAQKSYPEACLGVSMPMGAYHLFTRLVPQHVIGRSCRTVYEQGYDTMGVKHDI